MTKLIIDVPDKFTEMALVKDLVENWKIKSQILTDEEIETILFHLELAELKESKGHEFCECNNPWAIRTAEKLAKSESDKRKQIIKKLKGE